MMRPLVVALAVGSLLVSATPSSANEIDPRTRSAARWKINTHLFAANKALADAIHDGKVTIPPYGEFPVSASALKALRAEPAAYRAGVLAPDLFPDMYTGGWVLHSDTPKEWNADQWMRHVWTTARGWQDAGERDKVLAFAYGYLTHGAGDMFAHTYVNQRADGAWVTFTGPARSTAVKHVVLEGYVGAHTPPTDLTLDVWPRFVANVLIKDARARQHMPVARHYQRWLEIYDWLGPQIERAKKDMNKNINNDAPYWMKCAANPVPCAKKEQMEAWRLDINRGFRAMVDSSQSLGEALMHHEMGEGLGAMTGWMKEWVPKMFGAHAVGEAASEMAEFMDWVGDPLAPINEAIMDEVKRFMKDEFPQYYALYLAVKDPATQMDNVGFPAGMRQRVDQEMGIPSGSNRTLDWRAFEPMYNTVIMSKLILLDGDGLNELARRAGVTGPLFKPGEDTNIMLGVFKSLTQSYQWLGDVVRTDTGSTVTRFGICGPEDGSPLPDDAVCGIPGARDISTKSSASPRAPSTGGRAPQTGRMTDLAGGGGFLLWQHPEAREKVFGVIIKGFGPGPGTSTQDIYADLGPAPAAVRLGSRALNAASDQAELIREIVAVMQGKIGGVVRATAVPTAATPIAKPGRLQPATRAAPAPAPATAEVISDWGKRCCAKDVAEIRAALRVIAASRARFQSADVTNRLGRRPASTVDALVGQVNAALTAFENTRDTQTAAAALANVARQSEMLTGVLAGTR
jgi:hypothetical protein